ncbi:uncharacterized protein [Pseudochaenichthys georgianus]|uniref:uncharacterized protein n=1 Tax=Pseudochaenichthys georgianus TaxID=52239 RepID=UPI00146B31C3|nr:uncharacterized protein LOC117454146 [Pseudochaenichthys georgianus]
MLLLWATLLFLHQGYTLVPVTTVPLGESVILTCALPNIEFSSRPLYWFKQNAGETLTLIVTLLGSTKPEFAPTFSDSRLEVKRHNKLSTLTIRTTIQEDEGMYHCSISELYGNPVWSGTHLLLKGNTQRTSNYSVQWPTLSDPAPPANSMTLQCSVLSKSENKTCPGDISVFWFRAGSDKSRPGIIYTDGRRQEECEKLPDTQKSCVYHFSKNFSSSDALTYYCAVATCGEILFGDVTKLKIERNASSEVIALAIAILCLVVSIIGNITLFCRRTSRAGCSRCKGNENVALHSRHDNSSQPVQDITEGGHDLNYAALHFSGRKATRGGKKRGMENEESVYSQVKC